MPLVDVTYPAGALTVQARTELVESLTDRLLKAERLPDAPLFRGMTWVYLHEVAEDLAFTGGRPSFRLDVRVLAGALDRDGKAGLIATLTQAVADVAAIDPRRIWVIIQEVDEGNWGAGGHVATYEALAGLAADYESRA
ncbi:tautomerase family protein [Spirillospora sp. CA-294931]|uniref:tautomerase family protein n=1 Tax=Spirillospora sp. CA-294931 TaxID=3240042 RepID=UPI003D8A2287